MNKLSSIWIPFSAYASLGSNNASSSFTSGPTKGIVYEAHTAPYKRVILVSPPLLPFAHHWCKGETTATKRCRNNKRVERDRC